MIRNFNTSHVVVYPIIYDSSEERYFYFNTSHVVVYLTWNIFRKEETKISIHLMLQFILNKADCFNTHCLISIHLMLQFIFTTLSKNGFFENFNTSHVVVYHRRRRLRWRLIQYFNTSHVVYRRSCGRIRTPSSISIHLMLQFIHTKENQQVCGNISIHLMLQFI